MRTYTITESVQYNLLKAASKIVLNSIANRAQSFSSNHQTTAKLGNITLKAGKAALGFKFESMLLSNNVINEVEDTRGQKASKVAIEKDADRSTAEALVSLLAQRDPAQMVDMITYLTNRDKKEILRDASQSLQSAPEMQGIMSDLRTSDSSVGFDDPFASATKLAQKATAVAGSVAAVKGGIDSAKSVRDTGIGLTKTLKRYGGYAVRGLKWAGTHIFTFLRSYSLYALAAIILFFITKHLIVYYNKHKKDFVIDIKDIRNDSVFNKHFVVIGNKAVPRRNTTLIIQKPKGYISVTKQNGVILSKIGR